MEATLVCVLFGHSYILFYFLKFIYTLIYVVFRGYGNHACKYVNVRLMLEDIEEDSEQVLVEYLVAMLDNNGVKDTAMLCISTDV